MYDDETVNTVINISKLSSTHLVSNIRQQRRCSQDTSFSTVPYYSLSDNTGREVARFHRPFKLTCRCCTCYCPCCLQEMEITASGQVVGYILQKQDFCKPKFQICDADKKVLLELKGPVCVFSCCCNDIDFDVRATNRYDS